MQSRRTRHIMFVSCEFGGWVIFVAGLSNATAWIPPRVLPTAVKVVHGLHLHKVMLFSSFSQAGVRKCLKPDFQPPHTAFHGVAGQSGQVLQSFLELVQSVDLRHGTS